MHPWNQGTEPAFSNLVTSTSQCKLHAVAFNKLLMSNLQTMNYFSAETKSGNYFK